MTGSLLDFLARERIDAELLVLAHAVPTAAAAAMALGVGLESVFKSLVMDASCSEGVIAVVGGERRVSARAVSRLLGVSGLSFTSATRVLDVTGYPAGGVPPFGFPTRLRVAIDDAVWSHDVIYCGGGRPECLIRIAPAALVRASGGIVGAISLQGRTSR